MDITIKMLEAISSLFEREKQLEDKKRAEGDLFNVFNTIGLRTEEVRLHSAFIAELLNPQSGAWIYRKEWKYYGIFVWTRSKKYWSDLFVGISWYNYPNRNNKIYKKDYHQLNCLTSELPDEEWPYGKEYLRNDIRDWAIDITEKIVNGEVINYIKQKIWHFKLQIQKAGLAVTGCAVGRCFWP